MTDRRNEDAPAPPPSGLLGRLWQRFTPRPGQGLEAPGPARQGMVPGAPRADIAEDPVVTLEPPAVLGPAAAGGAAGPVFIDLETRSAVDIEVGGRRYANDLSTAILT